MSPFLVGLLVPLGAFAMVFGIVYLGITARNRERMALIERGADPTLFECVKKGNRHNILRWGTFLFGIGLGIVIADMLVKNGAMNEDAAYFSMIFIFGGLALIGTHIYQRKQDKQDEVKI
jgi:hypothetical protein